MQQTIQIGFISHALLFCTNTGPNNYSFKPIPEYYRLFIMYFLCHGYIDKNSCCAFLHIASKQQAAQKMNTNMLSKFRMVVTFFKARKTKLNFR